MKQLENNYDTTNPTFNLSRCFDIVVALQTNTALYRDLSLKEVELFEQMIDWEKECPDLNDETSNKPPITHINIETKTLITSYYSEDSFRVECSTDEILAISNIADEHGWNYKIAMNVEIPRIILTCKRLKIPAENIITINEDSVKNTYTINHNLIENQLAIINKSCDETNETDEPTTNNIINESTTNELLTSNLIQLRPYQQEYIDYMNSHNRAILKLPCGMGKSLIMIYHMMTHKQNSYILVPNIALVEQFKNNINFIYNAFHQPLPEIHCLYTKNTNRIDITNQSNQQIIIAVYNSFVNQIIKPLIRKRKPLINVEQFDYIYIDEAHHVILPSNKSQKQNINSLLTKFMKQFESVSNEEETINEPTNDDNSFIELLNRLPKYMEAFSNLIFLFADNYCLHSYYFSATIEPANFTKYNMFAAISENYLCRLNIDFIVNDHYSKSEVNSQTRISDLVDYLKKCSYQSIIIYTSLCSTAERIRDELKQKQFTAEIIKASTKTDIREQYFNLFREHRLRVLLTVNCISEGVDLPNADTAIFFDEKRSIINIIQCVGRVMRKCEGKLSSSLVVPVYTDDDIDNLYKNILTVINGELGYGTADLRRILTVKFNATITKTTYKIKEHIKRKIYEYNETYFQQISLYNKLRECAYQYDLVKIKPPFKDVGYFDKIVRSDGSSFNLSQFVNENLYLDNTAGRELRKIYGISIDEKN